ncbi:MAG: NAAT family transporter [Acidobacteria bacterium]|nr:NAAT family transporter [Acidobacteriota bacterium]
MLSAIVTLLLVMDPLGNVPLFLSVLREVPPERRAPVLRREILLAYVVLLAMLATGRYIAEYLQLRQETISIAGGIVLFLIALRMVFPREGGLIGDQLEGEPFLVPLAIPLLVGPSTLATVLLLEQSGALATWWLFVAVTIAWAVSGIILLSSTFFYRVLRERGLVAMERLMGMLLVMVAVQMFVDGARTLLR